MNRTKPNIMQLIRSTESLDPKVSEDSRETLQGLISQGEGIGQLVTYYIQNRSPSALELLCRVKEPYDTELCNRIQDILAKNTLATLTLLGELIQRTPSWLPKLAEHSIFDHILKFIKPSENVVVVVSSILLVSSLLPHFAALRKSTLHYLFRLLIVTCNILYKFKKLLDKRETNAIEGIYASHLYSAAIQYFIVLYGIYPVNLVEYLRNHVNVADARAFCVLKTLLCAVKFHPNILTMTVEQELDRSRWSQREAHDFLADCRHILVRPVLPTALKVSNLVPSADTSASTLSYVSQLPDLNDLFSTRTKSSSTDSLNASLDHWNEDSAWPEAGKNDFAELPESRSSSLDSHAAGIIINSSTESKIRRATTGAVDLKHIRRSSFTQKINDFMRKKKSRTLSDELLSHTLSSPRTHLNATGEDIIGSEPIEEIFLREDTQKPDDEIEEGVDAREICSPSISFQQTHHSENSFVNTPATIVPLENMHQPESEAVSPNSSEIPEDSDLVPPTNSMASTSIIKHSEQIVDNDDDDVETVRYRKTPMKELNVNEGELPSESISNDSANRFSVTSFFRKVSRQRFISECTCGRNGIKHFRGYPGSFPQAELLHAASCPDLLHTSEVAAAEKVADLKQHQSVATAKHTELSVKEIEEIIARKCPYLPFLQALPFSLVDEESLDKELKCEHERTRQNYIEAGADYHTCLKQLSLADRLPTKIYDDMSVQLKGLLPETQIKVLNARLALVNQHLLYERCGRLLHAERNRRLFGRLKQQKSSESEKISLSMALHNAYLERDKLVNALNDLRKQGDTERLTREEMEKKFCEEIQASRNAADRYSADLANLELEMKSVAETSSRQQVELEMYKRRCEDAEMKLLFAESRLEEICVLQMELRNANHTNQQLRDEVSLLQKRLEGRSSPKSQITSMEHDVARLMAEIIRLKSELVEEHNAKELERTKAQEFEDELTLEKRRCDEFCSLFERAKKVHSQQCEAAQHKYSTLLSICQKQHSHILKLYTKIEEIAAISDSKGAINIAPHLLFPNSFINEIHYSSGSSRSSFFPSELFEEKDANDEVNSSISDAGNSGTVMSSSDNCSKEGLLSFSP